MTWPIPPSSPEHRARRPRAGSGASAVARPPTHPGPRDRDEGPAAAADRARRARASAVSPASRAFGVRTTGAAAPTARPPEPIAASSPAPRMAAQHGSDASAARSRVAVLVRSLALGAATGARSSAGIAAVALTSAAGERGALAARLGARPGTAVAVLLAAGELAVDKLPGTPSRLSAQGLVPRLTLGATSAAALAQRDGHPPVLPAVAGAAGAAAAAVLCLRWRGYAADRFGTDWPGALIEDAATALVGWAAARRSG